MIDRFKPTLREEYRYDIEGSLINLLRRILVNQYPYRNCLNCIYFTESLEYCKHWKAKPPARVIAYGCQSHEDVNIPF